MEPLLDLIAFTAVTLSTTALGYAILGRLGFTYDQLTLRLALAGGLGLGLLSYFTLLLTTLHVLNLIPPWSLLAAFLIAAVVILPRSRLITLFNTRWNLRPSRIGPFRWGLLGIVSLHMLINLISALAPVTGVDSLTYHLAVPAIYLREGGMEYLPSIFPSNWPLTVDMLFLYGMWLRADALAQLMNSWAALLTILGLYGFIRRWASSWAALIAGGLYLSISDVVYQSSVALIDVTASLFLVLSFITLVTWSEQRQGHLLILAGIFAGWFAASRITNAGLVIGLGLALVLILVYRKSFAQWKAILRPFWVFGMCALLIVLPWYLRSWIYTGNPVYPALYSVFGGRNFSAEAASNYTENVRYKTLGPRSLIGLLQMPWVLTNNPHRYRSGFMGPVILACFPLLFLYRRKLPHWAGFALLFTIVSIPIWYFTYTRLRTFLPVIAILIALLTIAIYHLWINRNSSLILRLLVMLSIALWLVVGLANNWRVHGNALAAVVGVMNQESYVDAELRSTGFDWYQDYQHLNQVLPKNANVLIWDQRGYYLQRDYTWALGLTRGMATPEELQNSEKLLSLLYSLSITHAAWHPLRDPNKDVARLRETLLASGCTSLFYNSGRMVVVRLAYERPSCRPN